MINLIYVFDRYGNNYQIAEMLHEYFIECQYNWSSIPDNEFESQILEEFKEELITKRA